MQNNPTWLPVVAGLLLRSDHTVLLQKRPIDKPHGGLWEFPGGKVETLENPREALVRELYEELAIHIEPADLQPVSFAEMLPSNPVVLFLYKITCWSGDPAPMVGAELNWTAPENLDGFDMPPLDQALRQSIVSDEGVLLI